MWSVINLIKNERKHKPITNKFMVGDRETSDSKAIAEHIDIFFSNVAKHLAANIPEPTSIQI